MYCPVYGCTSDSQNNPNKLSFFEQPKIGKRKDGPVGLSSVSGKILFQLKALACALCTSAPTRMSFTFPGILEVT